MTREHLEAACLAILLCAVLVPLTFHFMWVL
jgi:hypothetical protein